MSIVRVVARPLVASGYIASGLEAYRHPSMPALKLDAVLHQVEQTFPQVQSVTSNRTQVAKTFAAAKVAAGSLLAIGLFPRVSASVLLAGTAVDAFAEYQAADTSTTEARTSRRNRVLKDLSQVGALMIVSVDTAGSPSLAWRAGDLAGDVRKSAAKSASDAKKKATQSAADTKKKAAKASAQTQKKAAAVSGGVKGKAEQLSGEAAERAAKASRDAKRKLAKAEQTVQGAIGRR